MRVYVSNNPSLQRDRRIVMDYNTTCAMSSKQLLSNYYNGTIRKWNTSDYAKECLEVLNNL